MKEKIRRCGLMLLSLLPIASVAFAAKSALSSAQIGKPDVSHSHLGRSGFDSRG